MERDVNPGQVVDQSQETPWQMFVIGNADTRLGGRRRVRKRHRGRSRPVSRSRIRVAALPGPRRSPDASGISRPSLDPKTRAVKVRAEIANPGGLLKDGMFADVTILRRGAASRP